MGVELSGFSTEVHLVYRADRIGASFALNAAEIFETAIQFLLESQPDVSDQPLHDAFFYHRTGAMRDQVESTWRSRLQSIEASQFPVLPHPGFRPRVNSMAKYDMSAPLSEGADATIVLWTAWAMLISSLTNSEDTVFGAVIAHSNTSPPRVSGKGAPRSPILSVVPIRMIIDSDLLATQTMSNARAVADETRRFQRINQHWLLQLGEDVEQACSFQTLLQVQEAQNDLIAEDEDIWTPCEDIALLLRCNVYENGIRLICRFDSFVIEPAKIERMLRQFGHLIGQLHNIGPDATIREIQSISKEDLSDIWAWNAAVPEDVEACMHDQFTSMAAKQPHASAICAWDGGLTYQELDILSTTLASHLAALDVKGTVVPLCFEKSKWTLVGMLGVMKAGAASVAMDPSYPESQLQSIVEQAHAHSTKRHLILSSRANEGLSSRLAQSASATVIVVEHVAQDKAGPPKLGHIEVQPEDLLYVVFTSGSTGTPKGAMISHKNFSSAIRHQHARTGLDSSSRVFDFASYAFDAAWFNALRPLAVGGCLCIPSEDERKNNLPGAIRNTQANYAVITPTAARLIRPEDVPSLRKIIFAGEKLQPSEVFRWDGLVEVGNCYGAAECTIGNTLAKVHYQEFKDPSIGDGCGTVTWIVRQDGNALAAIGEVGEIWLEGPLVGHGYLGNPERTAEAFVRDPPWLLQGAPDVSGRRGRLYRTGDLACYNPDGSLQFMGRKDSQVKIRGQRVELGGVEAHVKTLLASRKEVEVVAEVISPKDSPNPVLVAFISLLGSAEISYDKLKTGVSELTRGLNDKLLARLPPHMIPSTYIPIAIIPTTATGKTDRRKLRQIGSELDLLQFVETTASTLPSSELEVILAQSWADVLDIPVDRISISTPFTRLGGDSITAMQLISRLRAREVQVAVSDILRYQTIDAIAPRCRLLTQTTTHEGDAEVLDEAWGLSPVQSLFFSLHPSGLHHFNQSFLLELREPFTSEQIKRAATTLIFRHAMLRARFKYSPNGWEQCIIQSSPDAFFFQSHTVSKDEMHRLARTRQETLDIVNGPVFAVDHFDIGGGQVFVLLTGHHLIIDLVSWRILWRDMEELLKEAAPLPAWRGTSFRKWTVMLEKLGRDKNPSDLLPFQLKHQVEYWGVSPSENTLSAVRDYNVELDVSTTSLLLGSSNKGLKTEPLDIMLGVLMHSLHKTFPDRPTPAMFVEGHGREQPGGASINQSDTIDLSETIGWFTSLCPVQISLQGNDTLVQAIKLVKDTRRAIVDKGLPFFVALNHRENSNSLHDDQNVEFIFNYGGVFQQLESQQSIFRRSNIDLPEVSPQTRRMALVEVNGNVTEGALSFSVSIHQNMRHHQALKQWVYSLPDAFLSATDTLNDMLPTPTLSDFPLLDLSYDKLDSIMTQLSRKGFRSEDMLDLMPCTPLQEGILLGIARGSASYHIIQVWECSTLQGAPVDAKKLESAWRTATTRHSIFANAFIESAEFQTFLQVQLAHNPALIRRIQSATKSAADTLTLMPTPVFPDAQPPFSVTISEGPSDGRQSTVACRLDISHALIDAMSLPILLGDVANAYDEGQARHVPNFQAAVKEIMRVPLDAKWKYWREFLAGVEPCNIPSLARPDEGDGDGHHEEVTIDKSVTDQISAFCQAKNITRSTFLQVSWAMTLSQLTQKQNVCFGYVASGRDIDVEGINGMVGPFINTLVSRIDLGAPVATVLEDTGQHLVNHFEFQHISLAQLQSGLQLSGEQLFNTSMTVRRAVVDDDDGRTVGLRLKTLSGSNTNEVCNKRRADKHATYAHVHRLTKFSMTLVSPLSSTDQTPMSKSSTEPIMLRRHSHSKLSRHLSLLCAF